MPSQHLFKALADPTRREILRLLRDGSLPAGDIGTVEVRGPSGDLKTLTPDEHFPITRASLSHHFNLLKQADLVRTERRGQHIVYSLNTSVLEDAAGLLMDLLRPKATEATDES